MKTKSYIVIVQCHVVMERCSGYFCEKAFNERSGLFSAYPRNQAYRTLYLTCGGCCGRAVHRKLLDLIRTIKKQENIDKGHIVVHLSSCIAKDNFHGPVCPHIDYLKTMIKDKLGLDMIEGTHISSKSEERRKAGQYLEPCDVTKTPS